jgi:hypothetical protein
MKKFLLLLVAVVLAGGLVLSCSQPSSYEVTLTPGSAPAVEGEKIVAEQLVNSILVKWDAAEDSSGYFVYRKEVGADGPIDSTLILAPNNVTTSPKGVPYYFDTAVKDGVTYQYGVVSQSYKSGSGASDVILRSEVVWQAETETSKFAKAAIAAEGLIALPATPSYTASKIDTTPAGTGEINYVEGTHLTFSGLLPGYTYTLTPQVSYNTNAGTPTWTPIGGTLGYAWNLGDYVDDGSILFSEITSTAASNQTSPFTGYDNYGFRVAVSIGLQGGAGYYGSGYAIAVPSPGLIATASTAVSITP